MENIKLIFKKGEVEMSNAKKKPLHRALAALLALVMVLTLIPWQTTALAADEADGKTEVTITV